jgi:hypothetical protein
MRNEVGTGGQADERTMNERKNYTKKGMKWRNKIGKKLIKKGKR